MSDKSETHPIEGGSAYVRTDGDTAEVFIKPPDDHVVYARIGRVAAEWSHFEHVLDEIIWLLCPSSERQQLGCVTGSLLGHAPRYNVIAALLTQRKAGDAAIKRVEGLKNAAYGAAEARNRIVHDAWYVTSIRADGEPVQFRSMPPKDLRFGLTEYGGEAHFTRTLQMIKTCYAEAVKLWNEIFREYIVQALQQRLP